MSAFLNFYKRMPSPNGKVHYTARYEQEQSQIVYDSAPLAIDAFVKMEIEQKEKLDHTGDPFQVVDESGNILFEKGQLEID